MGQPTKFDKKNRISEYEFAKQIKSHLIASQSRQPLYNQSQQFQINDMNMGLLIQYLLLFEIFLLPD